jgi:thioredoxin-like negative regulator of GroEL
MERITSARQFDELLAGRPHLIVEFYTDWCPDCRRVEQAYAGFAEAHQDQATFATLNAEAVPEVAQRYDVRGIPSFLVFREGVPVSRLYSRDAKTVRQVLDFLEQALMQLCVR